MTRTTLALAVIVPALVLTGCASTHSTVTIENPAPTGEFPATVHPPKCTEMPLPEYPEALVEAGEGEALIRVGFRIDLDGAIRNIVTRPMSPEQRPDSGLPTNSDQSTIPDRSPAPFEEASRRAVLTWKCAPATRLAPLDDPDPYAFKPIPYDTFVVFHFRLEKGKRTVARAGE